MQAPAFSFYAKDFLTGAAPMSLAERGAYITLLAYQWDGGAVPDDAVARARILGCSKREEATTWASVGGKFEQGPDGLWRNVRLEVERAKQASRLAGLAVNGAKGAQKRWRGNKKRIAKAIAPAMATAIAKPSQNDGLSFSSSEDPVVDKEHLQPDRAAARVVEDEAESRNGEVRAFIARFCELYSKYRFGAKYVVKRERDVPIVKQLLGVYGRERLEKLAQILVRTDDEWICQTDRGIGILSTKASWLDSLLAEREAQKAKQTA